MKIRVFSYLLAVMIFALFSCNDPIFWTISEEVEPIKPRIAGHPTNFVEYDGFMYVASGTTIYRYKGPRTDQNVGWSNIEKPGGRIIMLASTSTNLYVLCDTGGARLNMVIKQFNGSWSNVPFSNGTPQYIYTANNELFIGSNIGDDFSFYNASGVKLGDGQLSVVAYDKINYYLCSTNGIIYTTTNPSSVTTPITPITPSGTGNKDFTSIINVKNDSDSSKDVIIAIARSGEIYKVTSSAVDPIGRNLTPRYASNALSLWEEDKSDPNNKNRLLLVGRQDNLNYTTDSGYTYGYLELILDENGTITSDYAEPGLRTPTTLVDGNNSRYKSTIGKHPVNHIFQASDGVLFASTHRNGVFSYRERKSGWQWNAED